uniref:Uncharacterized protein n=1 Tax=Pristionchus pacificus TaxID=54126 RepID=A0A8R1YQE1_PRIPA
MISAQPLQWLFKILRIVYRNRIVVKDNEKAEKIRCSERGEPKDRRFFKPRKEKRAKHARVSLEARRGERIQTKRRPSPAGAPRVRRRVPSIQEENGGNNRDMRASMEGSSWIDDGIWICLTMREDFFFLKSVSCLIQGKIAHVDSTINSVSVATKNA